MRTHTSALSSLHLCAAEVVPEECQSEVYDFMIVRGKNINANLPLGECTGRLAGWLLRPVQI
jgi:hypothetical protein